MRPKCEIPAVILQNIADLLQPFYDQPVRPEDVLQALELYPGSLYTVNEVAELLSLSKKTIYRMVESGSLHSVRVGRSIRITQIALGPHFTHETLEQKHDDEQGRSGSTGESSSAEDTSAARIDLLPMAPTTGPPAICPTASACPLTEKMVARTWGSSMLRLSQAVCSGSAIFLSAPISQ